MLHRLKVYVAGIESSLRGAQIAPEQERLCTNYGLECLQPNECSKENSASGPDFGSAYASCTALMLRADFGVFNLTPTAGSAPDAIAVFKLGMITTLGKPAYAYVNQELDPLERPLGLNALMRNSVISSYFAMHNRQIVLKSVPAKVRFSDLAGFEECIRAARRELAQV